MTAIVAPMTGPKPANFDEVQLSSERAVVIACTVIVVVTMILRTLGRYALRLKMKNDYNGAGHWLGLDDIFNFIAVLTFFGLAVSVLTAIDRGMGTHIERVIWLHGSKGVDDYNLAIYICALTYNTVLGFVKLSVLALYRRILKGIPSRTMITLNWCVFALVSCNTTINVLLAAFQCSPIKAAFNSSVEGKCINASAFYLGNASTGIVTDAAVYLLSIPIIRPLQMDKQRKISVLLTLLVGLFAVVTSCVRISFLPALLANPDTTWAMGVPMDWSVVEPAVGILVSSMPAIRSITYFWRHKYGNSQNCSSQKSQLDSRGHIQLNDYEGMNVERTKTTVMGRSDEITDADTSSESKLVFQGTDTGIFKTTQVDITHVSSV